MRFELSVVKKYLTPKRKQLSTSLIALLSITVISLVVWLILVFLSVTEGIEKQWLKKLTTLNAPLKILPSEDYFSSYYYLIDQYSLASNYQLKTIQEKVLANQSNPYDPQEDREMPHLFPPADLEPDGSLRDPVKKAFQLLSDTKEKIPSLAFQDYELSGALLRLQLMRKENASPQGFAQESQNFLTQVSYLASIPDQIPSVSTLLIDPKNEDLNHLIYLADREKDSQRLQSLLQWISIEEMHPSHQLWKLSWDLLPEKHPFRAVAYLHQGQISHLIIPTKASTSSKSLTERQQIGFIEKREGRLYFSPQKNSKQQPPLSLFTPVFTEGNLPLTVKKLHIPPSLSNFEELQIEIHALLQSQALEGKISCKGLKISKANVQRHFSTSPLSSPPWPYTVEHADHSFHLILPTNHRLEKGILLAKNFQDTGVKIGDSGYLSYPAMSASSVQEQRIPVYIAGFYDPGFLSVGNKCILATKEIAHAINTSSSTYSIDRSIANGIQIWFSNLNEAKKIKNTLQKSFTEAGIDKYWKIVSFEDYDFAKDLLQQFSSDRYLFTLIGIIILGVACCNIISLLILLVSDKKKEIGILQALGASKKSIGMIFGLCGMSMGLLSCGIGTILAFFTLHHMDSVVQILSALQGREAFNAHFFGSSLSGELSVRSVGFVLIVTPILSLLAGLIPALKACRLNPSAILRSE